MRLIHRLTGRLTYSNVIATAAIFIALGGASYAAVSIPANSVGQTQLAFPLGMVAKTVNASIQVRVGLCGPDESCPAPSLSTLATVRVSLKHASEVLVLGSTELAVSSTSPSAQSFSSLGVEALHAADLGLHQTFSGNASQSAQIEQQVSLPAGTQTIRLVATVQSSAREKAQANATQLTAIVLPRPS